MKPVRLDRDGPLATITIDSPPLNLFDTEMIKGLDRAIESLQADLPRALLIRAEGRVVSGGVNVAEFEGLSPAQGSKLWSELLSLVDRVEALPLPVVFAAHGLTLTAASTIVWYAPITSADTFVQSNGRITRPSQKNTQLIIMIEGTDLERRYFKRLKDKEKTQGVLLDMVKDSR